MTADSFPMPTLPPASARQGEPGHDVATDRQVMIRLLTLRTQGLTYAQIADELGYYDGSAARQALKRALERHEAENVAELRSVENMRLDADERVLRAIIADGSKTPAERIRAIDARTRLSARRSRLNGLDAPLQVELSGAVQAELTDVLGELGTLLGLGGDTVPGEVVGDVVDEPAALDAPEA